MAAPDLVDSTTGTMNAAVTEMDLRALSTRLGNQFTRLLQALGITQAQIDNGLANHPNDREETIYQLLLIWKRANGNGATYQVLCGALRGTGLSNIADELLQSRN